MAYSVVGESHITDTISGVLSGPGFTDLSFAVPYPPGVQLGDVLIAHASPYPYNDLFPPTNGWQYAPSLNIESNGLLPVWKVYDGSDSAWIVDYRHLFYPSFGYAHVGPPDPMGLTDADAKLTLILSVIAIRPDSTWNAVAGFGESRTGIYSSGPISGGSAPSRWNEIDSADAFVNPTFVAPNIANDPTHVAPPSYFDVGSPTIALHFLILRQACLFSSNETIQPLPPASECDCFSDAFASAGSTAAYAYISPITACATYRQIIASPDDISNYLTPGVLMGALMMKAVADTSAVENVQWTMNTPAFLTSTGLHQVSSVRLFRASPSTVPGAPDLYGWGIHTGATA